MATTGFCPVKGRLKDVINYAQNPDKTIERKYLDDDLAATLNYVENSDKTDQTMYVSGINCPKKRAYEQMMTTKRRYGKLGGNVAYHGYQSFQAGEVTPEEAHRIGIETARRMWGYDYEIVVTTHLNTDHLHNHIVVNSVSFRTGRKFENHISDHYKLREISDEVCREHGKSVIENAPFYGGDKAYWVRKSGRIPHKDMLRHDVDEALACTIKPFDFELYLRSLGYQFVRTFKYQHPSVIAPDWRKPVRLSSLGKDYSREAILRRLQSQREDKCFVDFYTYTPKSYYQRQPFVVEWFVKNGIQVWSTQEGEQRFDNHIDKLNKLREEVVKSIQGESAFSQSMLAGLVEDSEKKCESLKAQCEKAEREVESSKSLIKDLNEQYDEIISWSSLYDSAPIEAKKMIVNSMIKRVDVYRNYELNVELNMNIRQFFLGMEETENIPITA